MEHNIIDSLLSPDTLDKEKIIKNKKRKIIKQLKNVGITNLIKYMFNANMPVEVKYMIKDMFDYDNVSDIKDILKKLNLVKEEYLYINYVPKTIRKSIFNALNIRAIYNIRELLLGKNLSFDKKKMIIDILDYYDLKRLLEYNLSDELIDYIVSLIKTSMVTYILNDDKVKYTAKIKIINKKINKSNITDILNRIENKNIEHKIEILYQKEISEIVNKLTGYKLINYLNKNNNIITKYLYNNINVINKEIKKLSIFRISRILVDLNSKQLIEKLLKLNYDKVLFSTNLIESFYLLSVLSNKNIPLVIKNYIMVNRKKQIIKEVKNNSMEYLLMYMENNSCIPFEIQLEIFEQKKHLLNDYFMSNDLTYLRNNYCDLIFNYIVETKVNNKNIFRMLNMSNNDERIIDTIINLKNELFIPYITSMDINELSIMNINKLSNFKDYIISDLAKNKIIEHNEQLAFNIIHNTPKETLYELLNKKILLSVKKLILREFNIDSKDINNSIELIKYYPSELIFENYDQLKSFFKQINMNFDTIIQYGIGSKKYSGWLIKLVSIIKEDKISDLIKVKNFFFNNYYDINEKENMVYIVSSFIELIENFSTKYELCMDIIQNEELTIDDKLNIQFLFNIKNILDTPKKLNEISTYKSNLYKNFRENIDSYELIQFRSIFNDLIFCNANKILNNIGGTESLKKLQKDNAKSNVLNKLITELLLYSNIIEMVNDTNNEIGLKKVLKYLFSNDENLIKTQNMFQQFEKKVLKVYELDSQINLTKIDINNEELENEELSDLYKGKVLDLSDKNYVLYGHILGCREDIDNLVNGMADSQTVFMSLSPISYLGQKYYFDKSELIFAYDKILNGSYICSSLINMGTNYYIEENSTELCNISRNQRGIKETSAVTENNAETLVYREGLKPCGIILVGGKEPTKKEMEAHIKYNLPFIITQENAQAIDNPKKVFEINDISNNYKTYIEELNKMINMLKLNISIQKHNEDFTGREIAIITDCHSMYEPTITVLEKIRRKGITEIYSLGDNVGLGPNPKEVFDLLEEYNVKTVAGNSEYYNTLGVEPFTYLNQKRIENQEWTKNKLGKERIEKMKLYKPSIDLTIGNKKVGLCHFANDVRWDYNFNSTWSYQFNFAQGKNCKQFLYTNSNEAKSKIESSIDNYERSNGYLSAYNNPIFNGKLVTNYDLILQGHVHYERNDRLNNTEIVTLRALAMGDVKSNSNIACYYILKEQKDGGFKLEKCNVEFNKNSLVSSVVASSIPYKEKVLSFLK